jgi:hypothetical protein
MSAAGTAVEAGSMEAALHQAVRASLQSFGLEASVVWSTRTQGGRTTWRATLTPPSPTPEAPAMLPARRWSKVAEALQSLCETTLVVRGEASSAVLGAAAVNADYDATLAAIQVQERAAQVAASTAAPAVPSGEPIPGREDRAAGTRPERGDRPPATEEQRALALQAWLRHQSGLPLRRSHRDACKVLRLHPGTRSLNLLVGGTADVRALQRDAQRLAQLITAGQFGRGRAGAGGKRVADGVHGCKFIQKFGK